MANAKESQLLLPNSKPPVSYPPNICRSTCFTAKTDRKKCKCRCGGTFHGLGFQHKHEKGEQIANEHNGLHGQAS